MAKATLEFDLNDADDIIAHLRAVKSTDMALMIWHLLYNTKKEILRELEASDLNGEADHDYDLVDKIFDKIYQLADEHGIKIDELVI